MILFARIVTTIFHPVVLVTPTVFLIILASGESVATAISWSGYVLLIVLLVSAYILIGVKRKIFTNFDVSKRSQRMYLFPVIIFAGVVYFLSLVYFNGPSVLLGAILYFIFAIAILSFINLKIKASVHVGSVTAALVGLVYSFGISYIFLFILIPVMAWARVKEKKHTPKETLAGFIFGLVLALVSVFIVQYII